MHKYKTVVTDYEGMQGVLDTHSAQGWRLHSLTPDTWRKSSGSSNGMQPPPFDDLDTQPVQEYTASYYLLMFVREDPLEDTVLLGALEEPFPVGQSLEFDN